MRETIKLEKTKDGGDRSIVYTIWVKNHDTQLNISLRSLCITKKTAKKLRGLLNKEFEKKKSVCTFVSAISKKGDDKQ